MKKTLLLSVLSSALLASPFAFAGDQDILNANNQIGIQGVQEHMNYSEQNAGSTLDTEDGTVSGYGLSASLMKNIWLGNDYLALHYSHASGSTSYTGSLMSGGSYGSATGVSNATLSDFNARAGKGFVVGNGVMLTPFLELGHHEWDRNPGYSETYTNSYYGIGGMAQYAPVRRLVLTGTALLGETFGSNINVAFPSAYSAYNFSSSLGNSALYKLGVQADYAITAQIHANVGVNYASWNYGQSAPTQYGFMEPDSQTAVTTVSVGLGYAF